MADDPPPTQQREWNRCLRALAVPGRLAPTPACHDGYRLPASSMVPLMVDDPPPIHPLAHSLLHVSSIGFSA